jgi:hypothetical protein
MPYAADDLGRAVFLISSMAMHTQNLQQDSRASLLITQPDVSGDPAEVRGLYLSSAVNRKRLTNPGEDQAWDADQRAGVSWATSASLRRFMPGSTSMR